MTIGRTILLSSYSLAIIYCLVLRFVLVLLDDECGDSNCYVIDLIRSETLRDGLFGCPEEFVKYAICSRGE
jgi:hypothetical protein